MNQKKLDDSSGVSPDGCIGTLVEVGDGRELADEEVLPEIARRRAAGEPVALVTVIGVSGSAPRGLGAMMSVLADGAITGTVGGGNLEKFAIAHALAALADGRCRRLHYDFSRGPEQNVEKACLGTTDFFIQPFVPSPVLVIFGAGHVGRALAPPARSCGFRLRVADDRKDFLDAAAFPEGTEFFHGPFAQVAASLPMDTSTYAVIMTHGHSQDSAVLEACLMRHWRYLGLMGSHAKVAQLCRDLGNTPETLERLSKIHAPVGIDVGGRSPAEIAVSILAELQAVRYDRSGGFLTKRRSVPGPE